MHNVRCKVTCKTMLDIKEIYFILMFLLSYEYCVQNVNKPHFCQTGFSASFNAIADLWFVSMGPRKEICFRRLWCTVVLPMMFYASFIYATADALYTYICMYILTYTIVDILLSISILRYVCRLTCRTGAKQRVKMIGKWTNKPTWFISCMQQSISYVEKDCKIAQERLLGVFWKWKLSRMNDKLSKQSTAAFFLSGKLTFKLI